MRGEKSKNLNIHLKLKKRKANKKRMTNDRMVLGPEAFDCGIQKVKLLICFFLLLMAIKLFNKKQNESV